MQNHLPDHIVGHVRQYMNHFRQSDMGDKPWWTKTSSGMFIVKSAWEIVKRKLKFLTSSRIFGWKAYLSRSLFLDGESGPTRFQLLQSWLVGTPTLLSFVLVVLYQLEKPLSICFWKEKWLSVFGIIFQMQLVSLVQGFRWNKLWQSDGMHREMLDKSLSFKPFPILFYGFYGKEGTQCCMEDLILEPKLLGTSIILFIISLKWSLNIQQFLTFFLRW